MDETDPRAPANKPSENKPLEVVHRRHHGKENPRVIVRLESNTDRHRWSQYQAGVIDKPTIESQVQKVVIRIKNVAA
jgi:hypothetical protein